MDYDPYTWLRSQCKLKSLSHLPVISQLVPYFSMAFLKSALLWRVICFLFRKHFGFRKLICILGLSLLISHACEPAPTLSQKKGKSIYCWKILKVKRFHCSEWNENFFKDLRVGSNHTAITCLKPFRFLVFVCIARCAVHFNK